MPLIVPHTFITALKALKRNKMRSALDGPGRDHRRGGGNRHDGNRQGLEERPAKNHCQHGCKHAIGPIRGGHQRRRELRLRQRDDAHTARRRRNRPPMSGRGRRCAHCPHAVRKSSTGTATGCPCKSAAPRRRSWWSAIGTIWPKGRCSPTATCSQPPRCA